MFVVYEHSDSIRLPPSDLNRDVNAMVSDAIDTKYANRVLPNIGLVVGLFAIDKIAESIIYPGDGGAFTSGEERATLLMERPATSLIFAELDPPLSAPQFCFDYWYSSRSLARLFGGT